MKKILIIITILGVLYSSNSFGGLSHATSDNLDAINLNPAGLAVDRGLQFGIGVDQNNIESGKINLGLTHGRIGLSLLIDKDGKSDYTIGSGKSFSKINLSIGSSYSSDNSFKIGAMYRPENWFSAGVTHNYLIDSNTNGLRFASAFRPFGNKLTFSIDVFKDDIINNEVGFESNINFNILNGVNLIAGYKYNYLEESIQAGFSFNTSNINFMGIGNKNKNSLHNISLRYSSQQQEGFSIPSFKKKKKETLNFIELELDHVFIEEPIIEKKGFNFELPDLDPLKMLFGSRNNNYKQLKTFLNKMDLLTKDKNIDGLVIRLKSIGGGLTKLFDVRNALQKFKDSGKKIIIYADYISNSAYLVASIADEIYIPELSDVDLRGFNIEVEFYKDFLDTLGVVFEVEQISPYKSAMDPFLRNSMSPEMKENLGTLFNDVYGEFVTGIASGRGWTEKKTNDIIDNGPYLESEAIKAGLISGTMYPDEFNDYITNYNNKKVVKTSFKSIHENDIYNENWLKNNAKIAVVYAVGEIQLGKSQRGKKGPSSVMGNKTITEAIKSARLDKNVKGIVLRIDSGGGSALSSDLMWREIYKTTVSDTNNIKPLIASMSSVAASGGYYIACQADKIMASPSTITGSIGVISGRPNLSGLKEKLGIKVDGMKFGKHSDYYSGNKLWDEEERGILRDGILHVYGKFLKRVADGRDALDSLGVHEVAIGKVWSGVKAKSLNLVDEIGNLDDAINLTAEIAGIKKGEFQIIEYPISNKNKGFKLGGDGVNGSHSFKFSGTIQEIKESLKNIPNFENDQNQMILPYRIIIR